MVLLILYKTISLLNSITREKVNDSGLLQPCKPYLDLLYSNSMWRQSSIPTSILMEELSSG